MNKEKELEKLQQEVLQFTDTALYEERIANSYLPVMGEGSVDARIMFVGEAPGKKEGETGRPFVGRAGKILDELLSSVGLKREEVFITSIVKDRPPKNRDPLPTEIALYAPILDKQIEIIKPEIVATLGRFSMEYIMKCYGLEAELAPISVLHGKVFETPQFKLVPLYHPAAAIYNQKLLSDLKADFQILKSVL